MNAAARAPGKFSEHVCEVHAEFIQKHRVMSWLLSRLYMWPLVWLHDSTAMPLQMGQNYKEGWFDIKLKDE